MNRRQTLAIFLLVASLGAPIPDSVQAQKSLEDVEIAELRIMIGDMNTKEDLGFIGPGQVLRLKVGDQVRLRIVAIPAARHGVPRYPSARFELLSGGGRVSLSQVKEDRGSAVVTAVSVDNPRDPRAATVLGYTLLDKMIIHEGLAKNIVNVEVEPKEQPRPDGVTLYEHPDFQGRSETFGANDPYLGDNRLGQASASSVLVGPGCRATLFEYRDYQGRSTVVTEDIGHLGSTRVGNDSVASLWVDCSGSGWESERESERGVTLFEHQDFRGRREKFYGDDRQLNDNLIRQDTASSIRVDPGCQVTLFEHPDYQGRSTVLTTDNVDLNATRVGSDTVSSLEVECREYYPGGDQQGRRGVTLYEHQDFQGRSETFYDDTPRLDYSHIGHDTASSVRLDHGCRVTLYEHPDYQGRATSLAEDEVDLRSTRVGSDTVSSLKVRCGADADWND